MTIYAIGLTAVLGALYLYLIKRGFVSASGPSTFRASDPLEPGLHLSTFRSRHAWSQHRATLLHVGLVLALGFVTLGFEYRAGASAKVDAPTYELRPEVEISVVPTIHPSEPPPLVPQEQPKEVFRLTDIPEPVAEELPPAEKPLLVELTVPSSSATVLLPPPPPPPPIPPAPEVIKDEVFVVVEDMPRLPGCDENLPKSELDLCAQRLLLSYVAKHVEYPAMAKENFLTGKAVVSFVVEADGAVTGAEILRDPGGGIGREAIRVVEGMPRWLPGKQRGTPVRVRFNLPIQFTLD